MIWHRQYIIRNKEVRMLPLFYNGNMRTSLLRMKHYRCHFKCKANLPQRVLRWQQFARHDIWHCHKWFDAFLTEDGLPMLVIDCPSDERLSDVDNNDTRTGMAREVTGLRYRVQGRSKVYVDVTFHFPEIRAHTKLTCMSRELPE